MCGDKWRREGNVSCWSGSEPGMSVAPMVAQCEVMGGVMKKTNCRVQEEGIR